MATFRILSPNGEASVVVDDVEIQLREAARVHLSITAATLSIKNLEQQAVIVSSHGAEIILNRAETHQTTDTCSIFLADHKNTTQHTIVHPALKHSTSQYSPQVPCAVTKRRKLEEPEPVSLGYDLYRLRQGRAQPSIESHLGEWFSGEVTYALLSDYMVDLDWLLSAVPSISTIAKVLIVHGETRGDQHLYRSIDENELTNIFLHKPPLPIPFGTHHSKMCLLKFPTGIRVVVHTSNLIYTDCGNKTQGAWQQDFPIKTDSSPSASDFENDLLNYLTALQLPSASREELFDLVKSHDFSAARVKLIASVPGYHSGEDLERYGHMLVRRCLEQEVFASVFSGAPVVCQFSSLGSMDEKWLYDEFLLSLSAGKVDDSRDLLKLPSTDGSGLQLVWPTTGQVRQSIEGWAAGRSIPGSAKNVQKPFLRKHWHKFNAKHIHRERAMPHIKTYTRYASDSSLAWVLLASHNLSKAAWGTMQKKGSQFMIRSYEVGVLFLPSLERSFQQSPSRGFHCTNPSAMESSAEARVQFWPYPMKGEKGDVHFCLPYSIPPEAYANDDDPWVVDVRMAGLDCLGKKWGNGPRMYGHREETTSQ